MNVSEPHSIRPPMGKLVLKPSSAPAKAAKAIKLLRDGHDVELDCLETLDLVLNNLTALEVHCLPVYSTKGAMPAAQARRLRFDRGLDIRPAAVP